MRRSPQRISGKAEASSGSPPVPCLGGSVCWPLPGLTYSPNARSRSFVRDRWPCQRSKVIGEGGIFSLSPSRAHPRPRWRSHCHMPREDTLRLAHRLQTRELAPALVDLARRVAHDMAFRINLPYIAQRTAGPRRSATRGPFGCREPWLALQNISIA